MGLISRVSSRTYRFLKNSLTFFFSKWLTENPEPSFAETCHGTPPKTCSSLCRNSRTRLTSKSQPTEKLADHEGSASLNLTPLRNANKLCNQPKVWRLMVEKSFSLKVNHEKLKAVVAEAVTAVDEAVDTKVDTKVETAADEAATTVDNRMTTVETGGTKKISVSVVLRNFCTKSKTYLLYVLNPKYT